MKKVWLAFLTCSILFLCVGVIEFCVYKLSYNFNKEESDRVLRIAYDAINNQSVSSDKENEVTPDGKGDVNEESDIIGVLKIPKLQIEAPVKEGTTQEIMKTSIGHFTESDCWNGNVSFASHNGGTNAHFFESIKFLNENDEIEYITKLGTKKYKVQEIKKIESTDWSMVVGNNGNKNTVTLITCITGQPKYRLCVRGEEII